MARLVYSRETEVSVLSRLAVLDPVDYERCISSSIEGGFVNMIGFEGDSFATEPVADIVCVAVEEGYTDGRVEEMLEVV